MNVVASSKPFPHLVGSCPLPDSLLRGAADEMPSPNDPRWRRFQNDRELKLGGSNAMLGPSALLALSSLGAPPVCAELARIFGIEAELTMDTYGGGYHLIPPGGYLDMHVDFNRHANGLYRRLNMLVYLNDDYRSGCGGELLLRSAPFEERDQIVVEPRFGTMVVFATGEASWHGHPKPTQGYWRKSLAAYFYSAEPPQNVAEAHDTIYPERP